MRSREPDKIYLEDYLPGRSKQDTRRFLREFYTGSINGGHHRSVNSTFTWPWYIKNHHKEWKTGLEIGCGMGGGVRWGREKEQRECYGIDHAMIPDRWKEFGVEKYCCTAEAVNLPFKDNEFDVVMIPDVLEHIPEGDLSLAFSEMRRVGISHYYALIALDYEAAPVNNIAYTHITLRDNQWWYERLHKAEFKVTAIDRFMWHGELIKIGFVMEKHQPSESWEIIVGEYNTDGHKPEDAGRRAKA